MVDDDQVMQGARASAANTDFVFPEYSGSSTKEVKHLIQNTYQQYDMEMVQFIQTLVLFYTVYLRLGQGWLIITYSSSAKQLLDVDMDE